MNWWHILIAALVSGTLGFLCAAILFVGKQADIDEEDLGGTHCEGDAERLVHLIAKRYDVARVGEHVALLSPDTKEIAFIGRSLRDILNHSIRADEPEIEHG